MLGGLGGPVVSALDYQAEYRGFNSLLGRDNFQTISKPSSYPTCPGDVPWVEYKVCSATLGDRQQQVCVGDP